MRHILFGLLLILAPFFCDAKTIYDVTDKSASVPSSAGGSSSGGAVTTRTGGGVVTRSYTPKGQIRAKQSKEKTMLKKKTKIKQQRAKEEELENIETETDTMEGVLKNEAKEYHQEGYKLQSNGDLRGALTYYRKALEFDPSSAIVLNDLGVVYEGLGDEVSAVSMYKKAIQVNPRYLPAYTNLAFFYEGQEDIKNATYYWKQRYELGKEGEYWREQAAQHLLRLGTYPQIMKEIMNKKAEKFSDELSDERQEKKQENVEEAKLHYYIGSRLLIKRDFAGALKEFETALALNPQDQELKDKIIEIYKKTEKAYTKDKVYIDTQAALDNIRDEDFTSAEAKLRSALSAVYRVAQEK